MLLTEACLMRGKTSKGMCRGRMDGISNRDLCVRNTFLDTVQNTDGSQRIIIQRCSSAPAGLAKADLNHQHDGSSNLVKGQISLLLAHVVAMQEEEERTRQALREMQYLNNSLDVQVTVTR